MTGKSNKVPTGSQSNSTMPITCLGCHFLMGTAGYLRKPGLPKTYQPVFFCDNSNCERYGLVAFYKTQVAGQLVSDNGADDD